MAWTKATSAGGRCRPRQPEI